MTDRTYIRIMTGLLITAMPFIAYLAACIWASM